MRGRHGTLKCKTKVHHVIYEHFLFVEEINLLMRHFACWQSFYVITLFLCIHSSHGDVRTMFAHACAGFINGSFNDYDTFLAIKRFNVKLLLETPHRIFCRRKKLINVQKYSGFLFLLPKKCRLVFMRPFAGVDLDEMMKNENLIDENNRERFFTRRKFKAFPSLSCEKSLKSRKKYIILKKVVRRALLHGSL